MSAERGARREARERAVELLYEADAKSLSMTALLAELPLPPVEYAATLAEGVDEHRARLDEEIASRLRSDWRIDRLATLDLLVLRLGIFELCHRADVPTGVAISEAVDLAKQYSGEEAARFVNGVLREVAAAVRG